MRYGAIISALLHVAVLVLVFAGLPNLLRTDPPDMAMIPIEVVNIADMPQQVERQEPPAPEPPKREPPKPEPPKPEPPKPEARPAPPPPSPAPPPPAPRLPEPEPMPAETPPPTPPTPVAKPEPPKPEPIPEVAAKPEPPKPEPPKVEPKPPPPRPAAKPAPPPVAKAEPPKKKADPPPDEFQALLRNLAQERRQQQAERKTETPPAESAQAAPRRSALQTQMIAASLAQAVMQQVTPCWNIPAGARDAANMSVGIHIRLNPDGALGGAPRIEDSDRLGRDPFFRAVAESALRALRDPRCMPLELPHDQYDFWKEITFVFDPREALGQ